MKLRIKLCLALLGVFLSLFRPFSGGRQLTEYNFPVYTTEYCPRNETEWNMRSSVFNCTEGYSYACFPNDNITVLIEFCYPLPIIAITKDICLFLSHKRGSKIDSFNCTAFLDGCPKKPYRASMIYEHPNCVSIGNGCFTAEPNCQSSTQKYIEETNTQPTHKNGFYIFVIYTTVVIIILGISGVLFCHFKTRASNPKPTHENKPEGSQTAGSLKENEGGGSIIYQRDERNEDKEIYDVEVDAFPTSSRNQTIQNQAAFEIHDVLILHAKEDDTLAKDFKQDLLSNMEMPDLNVVLYEEFAPDVQSHFKSMEIVFQRCRYLFVVVTKNFKHDNLKKFQNEMALMDSLRNATNKGRIIPVWAETGAQQFLGELAVFKGIEYMPRSQFSKEEKDTVFKTIKNLFDCGKQINYLCD